VILWHCSEELAAAACVQHPTPQDPSCRGFNTVLCSRYGSMLAAVTLWGTWDTQLVAILAQMPSL